MKDKIIIFGAGQYCEKLCSILPVQSIEFIVDNDIKKAKKKICDIIVRHFDEVRDILKDYKIIIAVSKKYLDEIKKQLSDNDITNYISADDYMFEYRKKIILDKLSKRFDYLKIYSQNIDWILSHSNNELKGKSMSHSSKISLGYPEVTGYYIPTLIEWGYRDLAIEYAKWLILIQKNDGSWYDTNNESPYVFDTAQILRGLIVVREIYSQVDEAIIKACEWILTNMTPTGRLITPDEKAWGNDKSTCSELIHLYCLYPLQMAGKIYNRNDFINASEKIKNYYIENYKDDILNFNLMSHFYAYVMEALLELGEEKLLKDALNKLKILSNDGKIPAYKNVHWVCSTGLFQLAMVYYRIGEWEYGEKIFDYACKLQNNTGGWYGSYINIDYSSEKNNYLPFNEISWANKFFMDALYWRNKLHFTLEADNFIQKINLDDGRYLCVKEVVESLSKPSKILDVGCGKARYLRNLIAEFPQNKYYGVDINKKVMNYASDINFEKQEGSITKIPYGDDKFDVVYACESLEHAIDIKNAIKEMSRVLKPSGTLIIIDKNIKAWGAIETDVCEQWFDENELSTIMKNYCDNVKTKSNVFYDGVKDKNIFMCWMGLKKNKE